VHASLVVSAQVVDLPLENYIMSGPHTVVTSLFLKAGWAFNDRPAEAWRAGDRFQLLLAFANRGCGQLWL
jgi:hypothetical protein